MKLSKLNTSVLVGLFAMALTSIGFAGNQVIGNLKAENSVTVVSATGSLPIEGTYSFFDGDRIVTKNSASAGLTLSQGDGLYVGESSEVTVAQSGAKYIIQLDKGTTAFSFEEGSTFKIEALGSTIQASNSSGSVSGVVYINSEGKVVVNSVNGDLTVSSLQGVNTVVTSGENYKVNSESGKLIKVAVSAKTKSLLPKIAAVIGAAIVIEDATDDDDDDDAAVGSAS